MQDRGLVIKHVRRTHENDWDSKLSEADEWNVEFSQLHHHIPSLPTSICDIIRYLAGWTVDTYVACASIVERGHYVQYGFSFGMTHGNDKYEFLEYSTSKDREWRWNLNKNEKVVHHSRSNFRLVDLVLEVKNTDIEVLLLLQAAAVQFQNAHRSK